MKKQTCFLMAILLVVIIVCGSVSAANVTVSKTATKTGPDTTKVSITVNGPNSINTTNGADIVFAIDDSGSMGSSDPTNARYTAAVNFVNKMNPNKDQAAVVKFDNQVEQNQALTNNFNLVKTTIKLPAVGGGTNFDIALTQSISFLDNGKKAVNSQNILFLSDGQSSFPTAEVTDAKNKNYKIYTIGLGVIDPTVLTQMANDTGGKYYAASDAAALNSIYNQIFAQISTQTATNIMVNDVLPKYIQLVGIPTITPTSTTKNPDGTTKLVWNVGSLSTGQKWTVSYNVRSTQFGQLPTNVQGSSNVTYTDPSGVAQTSILAVPTDRKSVV